MTAVSNVPVIKREISKLSDSEYLAKVNTATTMLNMVFMIMITGIIIVLLPDMYSDISGYKIMAVSHSFVKSL